MPTKLETSGRSSPIELKKTKEAPKSLTQRYQEIQENIKKINERKQSLKKP